MDAIPVIRAINCQSMFIDLWMILNKHIISVFKLNNLGLFILNQGGKVRDVLFQILEDEPDVVIKHGTQSRESRRMATQGMHSSKFCLHPAGDTPSACRLFDAIVSLCVPVIVSDYIELPFENVINYRKISIFVDTASAVQPGYLTSMLRKINTEKILQYQQELRAVCSILLKYWIKKLLFY